MNTFYIAFLINLVFNLLLLVVELIALINALRFPPAAYTAATNRTKTFWVALTAGALGVGILVSFGPGVGMFNLLLSIAAFTVAGVFLAGVYPELKRVMGNRQGNSR